MLLAQELDTYSVKRTRQASDAKQTCFAQPTHYQDRKREMRRALKLGILATCIFLIQFYVINCTVIYQRESFDLT